MTDRIAHENESQARIDKINEARRRVFSGALTDLQLQAFKVAEAAHLYLTSFADDGKTALNTAANAAFTQGMAVALTGGRDHHHV